MADQIRATPRSPILGLFSDLVNLPLQYMSAPERTQQSQGVAQFLYGTGIPKTLERASYGESLFSGAGGLGGTTRMRPETAEAVMTVAPFAPVAGRVAGRMIKATEGMPVGMSIKDVGSKFNVVKSDASDIFGAGSERVRYTEPKSGGSIEVLSKSDGSASILSLEVPEKFRGQKIGEILQTQVMQDFPEFGGQFSSKAAAKGAYRLGLRPPTQPNATFDDVLKMIDEDSSVNMVTPQMQSRFTQQSPYPQQAALDLAQQRAALPVKPPTDDVYEVMDATFNYGKLGGNKTISIDKLTGGVRMSDPTEARRVKELADKISSPEGYISRIIVDDSGNVLEGQHRLEALRLLGEKNVPVSVIEDLSNKYDISAMENAIQGKLHPDQVTQLVREAIDTMEEAGSVEKALSDYSMPARFQQPFQDAIRASQKVTPTPIESPAFTDPFGNTIGSSIR